MNIALRTVALALCLGWVCLLTTGCSPKVKKEANTGAEGEHEHEHEKGKILGGMLFVLDKKDHSYHVEYVRDDKAKKVTVIVVGSDEDPSKTVPIEAEELVYRITKPEKKEVKLMAKPREGDGEKKSSQFEGEDEIFALDEEFEGEIAVTINGKEYIAEIEDHHHEDED